MTEFPYFKQFDDADFFAEHPMDEFVYALLDHPEPALIRLGGPRVWEQDKHPQFHAIVGFKNPPDFPMPFQPNYRSSLILVDLLTGESSVEDFPRSTKSPANPASAPKPNEGPKILRKQIDYPASRFAGAWGSWRLLVHTGRLLSNPLDFQTGNRNLSPSARKLPTPLVQPMTTWETTTERFGATLESPNPAPPGISIAIGSAPVSIDGQVLKHPATITVAMADDFPATQVRVPMRLLFGSDVNAANHDLEILIPKARMTKTEGGLVGHYTLDLAPLLIDSTTGQTVQTNEWYLTAICKGMLSGPKPLSIPVR
ncbi:MAG: hypothetical protein IPN71_00145 [Fibrobacteres bacterium]|jgi:hypothetical protein|nr:hypothetical protein [Fibrobacterota bacterium]